MTKFNSFAALHSHLVEESQKARQQHEEDMRKAQNLRKSRSIANVKPGKGPRIAR